MLTQNYLRLALGLHCYKRILVPALPFEACISLRLQLLMDLLLILDIAWEGSVPRTPYVPRTGDVLITLDVNNVAETSFWTGRMPSTYTGIRGAWIVAVETILSTEARDFVHIGTWASRGFCALCVYKEAEGGSRIACDSVFPRIASLLAPPGLGNGHTIVLSAENVFVVVSTNNFPIRPPMLQARWWCHRYNSLSGQIVGFWASWTALALLASQGPCCAGFA